MSEKLSRPSLATAAAPGIHPPFKLSRHMAIIFPAFLTILLPWVLLDHVERLPLGLPGRDFWISLPGTMQTTLKPPIVFVWYSLIHLLSKFPTTSYFYASSPGFRWIATNSSSTSSTLTPSSSEAQPTSLGQWRFSFAGLPSDPQPLSGTKPKSFFPFWQPVLVSNAPFVIAWIAYISGSIGEPGDDSYRRFSYWIYGISMLCVPFVYYLLRDGGAWDIDAKKE